MIAFLHLSRPSLLNLAVALETGRLSPPFSTSNVAVYVPATWNQDIVDELTAIASGILFGANQVLQQLYQC